MIHSKGQGKVMLCPRHREAAHTQVCVPKGGRGLMINGFSLHRHFSLRQRIKKQPHRRARPQFCILHFALCIKKAPRRETLRKEVFYCPDKKRRQHASVSLLRELTVILPSAHVNISAIFCELPGLLLNNMIQYFRQFCGAPGLFALHML